MTLTTYEWQHVLGADLWQSLTAEERAAALATSLEELNAATFDDAVKFAQDGNPAAGVYIEQRKLAGHRNRQDARRNLERAWNWRQGY